MPAVSKHRPFLDKPPDITAHAADDKLRFPLGAVIARRPARHLKIAIKPLSSLAMVSKPESFA